MPNRIIREKCRTSETLDQLSGDAERLFWRLVTVADDYGRFEADPRVIRAACFPLREDLTSAVVGVWFQELVGVGVCRAYSVNGKRFAHFPTWEKYQQKRACRSKYPEPCEQLPAAASNCEQPLADSFEKREARSEKREAGSRHENDPRGALAEVREKLLDSVAKTKVLAGGLVEQVVKAHVAADELSGFGEFYEHYPVKKARKDAERAWKKLHPSGDLRKVISLDVERRKAKDQDWMRGAIPYPATYLNAERWTDELREGGSNGGTISGRIAGPQRTTPAAAAGARDGWEDEPGFDRKACAQ